MTRRKRPWVSGLEAFSLTKRRLRELGTLPVTVEIEIPVSPYVYPSSARFPELLKLSPQDRRNLVRKWRINKHELLLQELPTQDYEIIRYNLAPTGVRLTLPANSIHKLFSLQHAESIRIEAVGGRKARDFSEDEPRLYSVKARFVFQVEDQEKGLQLCEERIFLMSARSEEDAKHQAMRQFRKEGSPSLTVTGHFCRWHFDQILDVCEPVETSFDPAGTEVYYEYRNRLMRPANEWHPRRKPSKSNVLGTLKSAHKR